MVVEATAESPAEGVGLGPVPTADEGLDAGHHGLGRLEVAVLEDPALEDAEPDLNLVDHEACKGVWTNWYRLLWRALKRSQASPWWMFKLSQTT
jgi:hypothetical protein